MRIFSFNRLAFQAQIQGRRDPVNQLPGQAQMAGTLETFSRTMRISTLAFIKENKLYRQIEGTKLRTGAELLKGTREEFCQLSERSVDQVDRDIANLNIFCEDYLRQRKWR